MMSRIAIAKAFMVAERDGAGRERGQVWGQSRRVRSKKKESRGQLAGGLKDCLACTTESGNLLYDGRGVSNGVVPTAPGRDSPSRSSLRSQLAVEQDAQWR